MIWVKIKISMLKITFGNFPKSGGHYFWVTVSAHFAPSTLPLKCLDFLDFLMMICDPLHQSCSPQHSLSMPLVDGDSLWADRHSWEARNPTFPESGWMSADVRQCPPKSAGALRFSSPQKNMPRASVGGPDARKLGIGSLPIIPAGTMIPARGIRSVRRLVRGAHPRSTRVRQCSPISAAVRRKRGIDSPREKHQEGRAGGANGWIQTGVTVPGSDNRGATAALALPVQNRKTCFWPGGHRRTLANIGGHSPRFGSSQKSWVP